MSSRQREQEYNSSTSPQCLTVVDFAAYSLVLPQAAEEANFSGKDYVVGNLVHQLFSWKQHMRISSFLYVNEKPKKRERESYRYQFSFIFWMMIM